MKWSLLFILLYACGDNSPFDEDYWPESGDVQEETSQGSNSNLRYSATLTATAPEVMAVDGFVQLSTTETEARIALSLESMPEYLSLSQYFFSDEPCSNFNQTSTDLPGNTETKRLELNENGLKSSILKGTDPDVSLENKNLIVYGVIQDVNIPTVSTRAIAMACGTLRQSEVEQ